MKSYREYVKEFHNRKPHENIFPSYSYRKEYLKGGSYVVGKFKARSINLEEGA